MYLSLWLCLQAAMSGETAGERRGVCVRPEEEPGVRSRGLGVSVRGANQVRTFQLSSESLSFYMRGNTLVFPLASSLFLVSRSPHGLPLSFSLCTGSWSILRTSCVTSSRTRCRRRSVSGWPPPSRGRRCCRYAAARTSRASGASCTLCRPASLWRGRGWFLSSWCQISTVHTDTKGDN